MKLALCIGNNEYMHIDSLKCAVNDAKEITQAISECGFDAVFLTNTNRDSLITSITTFANKINDNDTIIFYYAGHGFQIGDENYLIPIDFFDTGNEKEAKYKCFPVNDLIKLFSEKKDISLIIILDACRGAYSSRGNKSEMFSTMTSPLGSIIAFSTSPGNMAKEDNEHGIYTKYLLKNIKLPRVPVEHIFKKTREDMLNDKILNQIPWEHTSLIGDLYINPDNLSLVSEYSFQAYCDSKYIFKNLEVNNLVAKLKTHNWDSQSFAIDNLFKTDLTNCYGDDLFVLGRNIYQSAQGNCFSAIGFINNFIYNSLPHIVKIHILNGMCYEIYFNLNNEPRIFFKTKNFLSILNILENNNYLASKSFINKKINCLENLLYIYGETRYFEINLSFEYEKGLNEYLLTEIYYKGKNILKFSNKEDSNIILYPVNNLLNWLSDKLVCPNKNIILNTNLDLTKTQNVYLPTNIILIK